MRQLALIFVPRLFMKSYVMKFAKMIFMAFALTVAGVALSSCGGNEAVDKSGKEYTSAYICPMHCDGSGSDQPGKCPVCKMDYKENDKKED